MNLGTNDPRHAVLKEVEEVMDRVFDDDWSTFLVLVGDRGGHSVMGRHREGFHDAEEEFDPQQLVEDILARLLPRLTRDVDDFPINGLLSVVEEFLDSLLREINCAETANRIADAALYVMPVAAQLVVLAHTVAEHFPADRSWVAALRKYHAENGVDVSGLEASVRAISVLLQIVLSAMKEADRQNIPRKDMVRLVVTEVVLAAAAHSASSGVS